MVELNHPAKDSARHPCSEIPFFLHFIDDEFSHSQGRPNSEVFAHRPFRFAPRADIPPASAFMSSRPLGTFRRRTHFTGFGWNISQAIDLNQRRLTAEKGSKNRATFTTAQVREETAGHAATCPAILFIRYIRMLRESKSTRKPGASPEKSQDGAAQINRPATPPRRRAPRSQQSRSPAAPACRHCPATSHSGAGVCYRRGDSGGTAQRTAREGMMRTFVAIALLITNAMPASAQSGGSSSISWRLAQARHCCCYRGDRSYAEGQGLPGYCDRHQWVASTCVCTAQTYGLPTCSWHIRYVGSC